MKAYIQLFEGTNKIKVVSTGTPRNKLDCEIEIDHETPHKLNGKLMMADGTFSDYIPTQKEQEAIDKQVQIDLLRGKIPDMLLCGMDATKEQDDLRILLGL